MCSSRVATVATWRSSRRRLGGFRVEPKAPIQQQIFLASEQGKYLGRICHFRSCHAGRTVPWWLAGIAIVATTFASEAPSTDGSVAPRARHGSSTCAQALFDH